VRVDGLGPSERDWIEASLRELRQLLARERDDEDDLTITPEILDAGFQTWLLDWMMTPQRGRPDPKPTVKAFGIGFGQLLVDRLSLDWAVVTDHGRRQLAVRGQPGGVVMYPGHLVAKRWAARATGFFRPLYDAVREDVLRGRFVPSQT
jgi:Domain of unknown function (DUF3806)